MPIVIDTQQKQHYIAENASIVLTIGQDDDGNEIAIISTGGHPQHGNMSAANPCIVLAVEYVDELPNEDVKAWVTVMSEQKPWLKRN